MSESQACVLWSTTMSMKACMEREPLEQVKAGAVEAAQHAVGPHPVWQYSVHGCPQSEPHKLLRKSNRT